MNSNAENHINSKEQNVSLSMYLLSTRIRREVLMGNIERTVIDLTKP